MPFACNVLDDDLVAQWCPLPFQDDLRKPRRDTPSGRACKAFAKTRCLQDDEIGSADVCSRQPAAAQMLQTAPVFLPEAKVLNKLGVFSALYGGLHIGMFPLILTLANSLSQARSAVGFKLHCVLAGFQAPLCACMCASELVALLVSTRAS